jgi:hypothetical protein
VFYQAIEVWVDPTDIVSQLWDNSSEPIHCDGVLNSARHIKVLKGWCKTIVDDVQVPMSATKVAERLSKAGAEALTLAYLVSLVFLPAISTVRA